MNPELTMHELRRTVGNPQWLNSHLPQLLQALPEQWTACSNLILPFGFQLKLAGCNWGQPADVVVTLYWLQHLGVIEARADPHNPNSAMALIVRRSPQPPSK